MIYDECMRHHWCSQYSIIKDISLQMNVHWYVIKEKSSKDIDMKNERNGRDDNKHVQNINKINMEKSGHNTASSFIVAMTVCIIYFYYKHIFIYFVIPHHFSSTIISKKLSTILIHANWPVFHLKLAIPLVCSWKFVQFQPILSTLNYICFILLFLCCCLKGNICNLVVCVCLRIMSMYYYCFKLNISYICNSLFYSKIIIKLSTVSLLSFAKCLFKFIIG